ncbi:hypothetical protein NP233_g10771 [Leucocoprinus birnbaumii]|uniref:DUF6589 domain-containing protein n=1 Tax=Leucocoprinus birnbaumii TaxID=56174 RepID=A0AAD5VHL7_9AGAR|nr:hypothetical protein NP233_g10771 [Leucocoprinus birnbaumii]
MFLCRHNGNDGRLIREDEEVPENLMSMLERCEAKLLHIKQVMCLSIFMQSTNQKCNSLQAMVGLFLQAAGAPKTVVELLAHLGLSILTTSINRAVTSLSQKVDEQIREAGATMTTMYGWDNLDFMLKHATLTVQNTHKSNLCHLTSCMAQPLYHGVTPEDLNCGFFSFHCYQIWKVASDLIEYGPDYFQQFKSELGAPEEIECIPVVKTTQIPLWAMDISPSTPAANGQVLAKIFAQARIGDPNDPVPSEPTPKTVSSSLLPRNSSPASENGEDVGASDPQSELGLHDGELRGKSPNTDEWATEPMESEDDSDGEDETITDIMNKVVLVWGDLLTEFIQPTGVKKGTNTLLDFVKQIRKNEVKKFRERSPDFRSMHEVIQHVGIVAQLDLWRVVIEQKTDGSVKTLEDWAAQKPTWEDISSLAETIVKEQVAPVDMDVVQNQEEDEWDLVKENMMLFH